MKPNDFDKIAFVYDRLANLIFGKSIAESQKHFLNKIPNKAKVLILGGGTGSILEELLLLKPDVSVCYIEASFQMIERAKERKTSSNNIQFIRGTENDIPNDPFDVIITNFYLDLFSTESLKRIVLEIRELMASNSVWIATDFKEGAWWNQVLLKVMYAFFRVTANIEASVLPDWNEALVESGGRKTESRYFYGNFIEATVYQF